MSKKWSRGFRNEAEARKFEQIHSWNTAEIEALKVDID